MDTNTNAKTFADALAVLKRYAGSRPGPTKANALVELRIPDGCGVIVLRRWAWRTFTDVSASITAGGGTAGTVYVDADALAAAVKGTTGTLTIADDGERLTVTTDAGKGSAAIPLRDGADFPTIAGYPLRPFATIADRERDAMRGVLTAAASGGDARAVLTGVYFDHVDGEAIATDTYRMAAARLATVHASGIIPSDVLAIGLATGSGPMELHADPDGKRYLLTYRATKGPKATPRIVAVSVFGGMVEGPYPKYPAIVQPARDATDAYVWTITDAAGTADALRPFFNKRNTPVMLEAAGSAVHATATLPEGSGTLEAFPPIATDGRDEVLAAAAFNPSYFVDAVEHAGDGGTLRIRDGLKAAYFDGGDRYALLMPMRVN